MKEYVNSGPIAHIDIVVFDVLPDGPDETDTFGLVATASKMWTPRMTFSETAPPIPIPASPEKPEIVASPSEVPVASVADMYPNPRSGRMKNPKWRWLVSERSWPPGWTGVRGA